MMYFICKLLTVVMVSSFALVVPNITFSNNYNLCRDVYCGPNSLLCVCEKYDIKTDIKTVCNLAGFKKNYGVTMLGMYKAALELGLPARAVRMNYKGLLSMQMPCIVFTQNNHFSLIVACDKTSVTTRDYPKESKIISKNEFLHIWDGDALVFNISDKHAELLKKVKEKSIVHGPSVVFDATIRDFGTVDQDTTLIHIFRFTNIGDKPLEMSVRSTCSCTASLLSCKKTAPGENGSIQLSFDTGGRKGVSEIDVFCRTNDPNNSLVKLKLVAEFRQESFPVPGRLFLGELEPEETITRTIKLFKSSKSHFSVKNIVCPEGVISKVLPALESEHYNHIIPVKFTFSGIKAIGEYQDEIMIKTNDTVHNVITIPVSAIIVNPISVVPQVLLFKGINTKDRATAQIHLSSSNNRPFTISTVRFSSASISTKAVSSIASNAHTITVDFIAPEVEGVFRGICEIDIAEFSDIDITVPVIANIHRK